VITDGQCRPAGFVYRIKGDGDALLLSERRKIDFELLQVRAGDRPLTQDTAPKFFLVGIGVELLQVGL